MITGFNTDIDYNGVIYHVQTEDKGLDTPLILSLVYDRGTILASKRSPYNDLLIGSFNEKELVERLNRQHTLICAAIRAGRIEDLKQMNSKKDAAKKTDSVIKIETIKAVEAKVETVVQEAILPILLKEELENFEPIEKPQIELPKPPRTIEIPKIEVKEEVPDAPIEITDADLIFEDTQNLTEVIMLPDEAVEIITAFSQMPETTEDQLFIELLNEVAFRGGESKTISIMVGRGKERNALVGVNLMIKVLGSNFRPLIFHTKTDSNGVATLHLQIPPFSRGRAAVLVKAMNNGDESELRRVIHPG